MDKQQMTDFYYKDLCEHKALVRDHMDKAALEILKRGRKHDNTKYMKLEEEAYIEPVWKLNHEKVPYGSEEYKATVKAMGPGWEHHKKCNDHHIDDLSVVNLFAVIEMCCDWIAASERNGNSPLDVLPHFIAKTNASPQIVDLIKNTIIDLLNEVK